MFSPNKTVNIEEKCIFQVKISVLIIYLLSRGFCCCIFEKLWIKTLFVFISNASIS